MAPETSTVSSRGQSICRCAALELIQTGTEVTGAYAGSAAAEGGGGFVLTFSADGKSFTGTWGTGTSRNNGGAWVGTRK